MSTATLPARTALMTAEEFLQLHGDESGVELVRGYVLRHPMPGATHGSVCYRAARIIGDFVETRGLGRLMTNDTHIRVSSDPDSVRGADVCFLSFDRYPKELALPTGPLMIAPELICEVRSPTDRIGDINVKIGEYQNAGVQVVILLDPAVAVAAVYRPDDAFPLRFSNGDELTLPDILPGFSVPVRKFFE
jgi:Uma2 family endonuclease